MKELTISNVEPIQTAWFHSAKPSGFLIHFTLDKNWQTWLFTEKSRSFFRHQAVFTVPHFNDLSANLEHMN